MKDIAFSRAAAQHAVVEHLQLISAGQIHDWIKLFAPDAVLEFPFAPAGVPKKVVGHEALVAHMSNFPKIFDIKFVDIVFHETVDPLLVITEFRSTGTALPTGKAYDQTCISVVRTNDEGLIIHYLDYWNPLVAIEALTPQDALSHPAPDVTFAR